LGQRSRFSSFSASPQWTGALQGSRGGRRVTDWCVSGLHCSGLPLSGRGCCSSCRAANRLLSGPASQDCHFWSDWPDRPNQASPISALCPEQLPRPVHLRAAMRRALWSPAASALPRDPVEHVRVRSWMAYESRGDHGRGDAGA